MARHDDYLAGQPGGSGPEEDRDFIGVPDGYTTPYRGTEIIPGTVQMRPDINPVMVGPSYEDGTEFDITRLSVEEIARLQGRLSQAGLIGPETRFRVGVADTTTIGAYKRALETANRYGMNVTEAIDMLAATPSALGGQVGLDGRPVSATSTSVSQSTANFTRLDAEALAETAFQEALGQDPTPKQISALRKALVEYARANPSVTETTTVHSPGGDDVSTSRTTGGVDGLGAAEIAEDFAQARPNYAEVQATTTYFNALLQALGPTTDVDAP